MIIETHCKKCGKKWQIKRDGKRHSFRCNECGHVSSLEVRGPKPKRRLFGRGKKTEAERIIKKKCKQCGEPREIQPNSNRRSFRCSRCGRVNSLIERPLFVSRSQPDPETNEKILVAVRCQRCGKNYQIRTTRKRRYIHCDNCTSRIPISAVQQQPSRSRGGREPEYIIRWRQLRRSARAGRRLDRIVKVAMVCGTVGVAALLLVVAANRLLDRRQGIPNTPGQARTNDEPLSVRLTNPQQWTWDDELAMQLEASRTPYGPGSFQLPPGFSPWSGETTEHTRRWQLTIDDSPEGEAGTILVFAVPATYAESDRFPAEFITMARGSISTNLSFDEGQFLGERCVRVQYSDFRRNYRAMMFRISYIVALPEWKLVLTCASSKGFDTELMKIMETSLLSYRISPETDEVSDGVPD